MYRKYIKQQFPGGPVVRTPCCHYGGCRFNFDQGTKIPQAAWHGQKNKNKNPTQNEANQYFSLCYGFQEAENPI